MKIVVVGPGAFGIKHLDGLKNIDSAEVVGLVGRDAAKTQAVADEYAIPNVYTSLEEALESDADAVILCTPTQMHAAQAIACMKAGKHVQVEIPLADSWEDAQECLEMWQPLKINGVKMQLEIYLPSNPLTPGRPANTRLAGPGIYCPNLGSYLYTRFSSSALGSSTTSPNLATR